MWLKDDLLAIKRNSLLVLYKARQTERSFLA